MGFDFSYEDMMEDWKFIEMYDVEVMGLEIIDGRVIWILELNVKVDDVVYDSCKMWIDQECFVFFKEEFYVKSGQFFKRVIMSDVVKIDGRWFFKKMNYKDMLKLGEGMDFIVLSIQFNFDILEYIFSKVLLRM